MAYDSFLKLDGMDGESSDDKYKGYVEVSSFSFGVTHMTTLGSATGGGGSPKILGSPSIICGAMVKRIGIPRTNLPKATRSASGGRAGCPTSAAR